MSRSARELFGERPARGEYLPAAGFENVEPLRPLNVVRLADVEPETLQFLWRGRIARGKVTMVVGDPGDGKSYLTLAIAAAITCGNPLPDSEPAPSADCIIWNGEDGIGDTIRVRAERLGAELTRLHVISGANAVDGTLEPFGLHHLPHLCDEITRRKNVDLVVIDPIGALLAGVDAHKDAEVRVALQPLADLARDTGTAVVVVAHLNKATAQRALYRVGGSIGFVGLARSVLLVAKDHETGRRAVAQVKSNLAEHVPPVEFRIDDDGLWWMGVAEDLNSDRLLADPKEASRFDDAKRAIVDALNGANGEIAGRELDGAMRDAGISEGTYKRARAALVRDGKLERHGGNRHQRELRWALSSANHGAHSVPKVIQTRNLIQTSPSVNHQSLSESSKTTLNQDHDYRARTREAMIQSNAQSKICSVCKRLGSCIDSDGRLICTDCLMEES